MRKITASFVIAISLFVSSCDSSQNTNISVASSTPPETGTPIQVPDLTTLEISPALNSTADKNDGLIISLGERNSSPWGPAIPAFSPNGEKIALVSGKARLWDAETYELIYDLDKPSSNCFTENVVFNTDGNLLAASVYCYSDLTGQLLVWDVETGILLHEWEQAFSKNTSQVEGVPNNHPATGITFVPNTSKLAFANGNTIEIRNINEGNQSIVFELGDEMVATDITISEDSKRLFAFMDFSYFKDPNEIGKKYALQIWDLESNRLVEEIDFPEPNNTGVFITHFDTEMALVGVNLIRIDYIDETFSVTNLETGNTRNLYYPGTVDTFVSHDTEFIAYLPERDSLNCKDQRIVLWDTRLNQSLYIFNTPSEHFGTKWCYGPNTIIFSPDNTVLAIAHEERVSLWDVSSFMKPKESGVP